MTWDSLVLFNLVLLAALASPGPAFLYAMRTSVAQGRTAGMAVGIGLAFMAAMWTLAAFMGLEVVFSLFPWSYTALKILGAAYLIYIAVQTWRGAAQPLQDGTGQTGRSVLAGMLVNLGNPKSMLFAASVLIVIFPKGLSSGEIAFIVANHMALEIAFYTLAAFILSTPTVRAGYLRLKPVLDRIAASVLGALGLRLLLEK